MFFPSTSPSAANSSRSSVAVGSLFAALLIRSTPTSGRVSAFCATAGAATHSPSAKANAMRFIR
jgi:hypothetical protein